MSEFRKHQPNRVTALGLGLVTSAALAAGCSPESEAPERPDIVAGYVTPDDADPTRGRVDTCISFEDSDGTPKVARIEMIPTVNGGPNLARRLTSGASSLIKWNGYKPQDLVNHPGQIKEGELPCSFEVSTRPGDTLPEGMGYVVLSEDLEPKSIVGPYGPNTVDDTECAPAEVEGFPPVTASSPSLGCVAVFPLVPNS